MGSVESVKEACPDMRTLRRTLSMTGLMHAGRDIARARAQLTKYPRLETTVPLRFLRRTSTRCQPRPGTPVGA
jgi:hypothetical protein